MNLTKRNVLKSSAVVPALVVGGITGQLATCSNGQIVVNPAVLDAIINAVATGCNFIPTVETIVGLVGATFPSVAGVTTIAAAVLTEITDILCANIPTPATPVTGLKLKTGTTLSVPSHGWIIQNGKLTYV